MDIMMPRMNGRDAARTIRAMNRPDAEIIPIIAMSANAFSEDIMDSRLAGMDIHLTVFTYYLRHICYVGFTY